MVTIILVEGNRDLYFFQNILVAFKNSCPVEPYDCIDANTVIPDVPDLAPDANRSMRAHPDDPYVRPKRSPETRYDEQRQNI